VKVIGLDVGMKTIGVAASDELGLMAHPRRTLGREGTRGDVAALLAVVKEEQAERVVVGLPLTLEGAVGPRAKRVMVLVDALREALGEDVPVETWDERFSTAGAERPLLEADLSRAKRKEIIDTQAAVWVLQGWLDAHARGKKSAPDREDREEDE
jgi:putative Holliday junction resolvase